MRGLVVGLIVLISFKATAQGLNSGIYLTDPKGAPIKSNPYVDFIGSPFYNSDWIRASIFYSTSLKTENVMIKLNLFSKEVHYLNEANQELALPPGSVTRIEFTKDESKTTFISGIKNTEAGIGNNFFQIIVEGNCTLLIMRSKKLTEKKDYNSAVAEKKFEEVSIYYIYKNSSLLKVKRDTDFFLKSLDDRKEEILEFISKNKLKLKKDSDLIELILFYNKL